MHELGVTQQILEIAEKKARESNATSIAKINLVIGDACTFVDDCVQFYFDLISKDSLAHGAQLIFKRIPLSVRCRHCSHNFTPEGVNWLCPLCQKWDIEFISGKEFYVDSIEVNQ